MSIDRIYYCDGPNCGGEGGKDSRDSSPVHAQTATPPPHLPSGFMELRGGQRSEDAHFCSWDCLMQYAAKHPPDEQIPLSDVPDL